jgi:acetyl esterase/lipase
LLPAGEGRFPVIVAEHGGAWRLGSRNGLHRWGHYLAARGYVLFSISYRLATKGKKTFPMRFVD